MVNDRALKQNKAIRRRTFWAVVITLLMSGILGVILYLQRSFPLWFCIVVPIVYAPLHPLIGKSVVWAVSSLFEEINSRPKLIDGNRWPVADDAGLAMIAAALWPLTVIGILVGVLALVYRRMFPSPDLSIEPAVASSAAAGSSSPSCWRPPQAGDRRRWPPIHWKVGGRRRHRRRRLKSICYLAW